MRVSADGTEARARREVGQAVTRLRATFDPANHRDDRGTRIDVEDAKFVERSALFRATLLDVVGAAQH